MYSGVSRGVSQGRVHNFVRLFTFNFVRGAVENFSIYKTAKQLLLRPGTVTALRGEYEMFLFNINGARGDGAPRAITLRFEAVNASHMCTIFIMFIS